MSSSMLKAVCGSEQANLFGANATSDRNAITPCAADIPSELLLLCNSTRCLRNVQLITISKVPRPKKLAAGYTVEQFFSFICSKVICNKFIKNVCL